MPGYPLFIIAKTTRWYIMFVQHLVQVNIKENTHTPHYCHIVKVYVNTLRPRQNGRHFADDTFKRILLNENVWISINISLKFVPQDPINNIPALVQIMAWSRRGDKPLSGPMMVRLPTHICVTRPHWSTLQRICVWFVLCCASLWFDTRGLFY